MSQTGLIVGELKRALRERGVTYAMIAKRLRLSEATVKRWFSNRDFKLEIIDRICDLADIDLTELLERLSESSGRLTELTEPQERELMTDPKLFLMTYLMINRWKYEDIIEVYDLSGQEAERLLIRLDRLKIIELQPFNKVRLLVSRQFRWRANGPIQRFFQEVLMREFFSASFDDALSEVRFFAGPVTEGTLAQIKRRIVQVAKEIDEFAAQDAGVPIKQRFGAAIVLAARPWHFSGFNKWKRPGASGATR